MINNNRNISLLSDKEMNNVKGGFIGWAITAWGISMFIRESGQFDSGSMSEEEYGDWVEGISGAPYDWGD